MIRTRQIPLETLLERLPGDSRVGILGCGDCAAVLNTGGTRQVDELAGKLAGKARVLFRSVIDAPCDQRVLKRLLTFIGGLEEVDHVIVLACPAGVQSLSELFAREGRAPAVIAGLTASGLGLVTSRGVRQEACIFCPTCTFDFRDGFCPVALCPLHRSDGPCQHRPGDDRCPLAADLQCIWLDRRGGGHGPA